MRTEYPYFGEPTMDQDIVLTTKFHLPSSIHPLVSRPRLLHSLNQGLEGKLTLLCAPAGSGKTTLFTDWLYSSHSHNMSVAWVSLDENENDLAHFWHYIYTALEQATGERFSFSVQNAFYSGKSRYIVDYLLEEVIDRQPEAIQTFLLSTALLDRLCGPLCASILHAQIEQEEQSLDANRSAQEMLEQLESSHLFLD